MDPSKEGSSAITTEAVIQSQTKNEINVNVRWDPKYVRTYPGILKTFALVRLSKLKSAYVFFYPSVCLSSWLFDGPQYKSILASILCIKI